MTRENLLSQTFVELADSLVDDFDVVDVLTLLAQRCVELFDVTAAGLMLVAPEGDLRLVASSSEEMRVVEIFELQSQEGPCPDSFRTGQASSYADATEMSARWPAFAPVALAAGFQSVQALPLRLRGMTVGALNLFRVDKGALGGADMAAAQALADVATIAILQHRATVQAHRVVDQLNHALGSRVVIEQAKGILAERARLDMESAFSWLRKHARDANQRLGDVAQAVIDGTLVPEPPRLDRKKVSRP